MNPEMTTPISDLFGLALVAWLGMGLACAGLSPRVRAWLAKRAGGKR